MSTVEEVMDQSERVLGEIDELRYFVNELQGYISTMQSMVDAITPIHWDGGDELDTSGIESEIDDIVMTANDFTYDVNQIESYTDRILSAVEDLKGLTEEVEEEEGA